MNLKQIPPKSTTQIPWNYLLSLGLFIKKDYTSGNGCDKTSYFCGKPCIHNLCRKNITKMLQTIKVIRLCVTFPVPWS